MEKKKLTVYLQVLVISCPVTDSMPRKHTTFNKQRVSCNFYVNGSLFGRTTYNFFAAKL